ncbi:hypothetical protein ASF62_09785 [Leifsonia sp. Leaf325]|nr:dihydrofolate reductase family protein [Leifsonia sp. Leaf325]KQQ94395.1 hypothetical protein ASF62_09785 [Leifsonia sp. Leaf325]
MTARRIVLGMQVSLDGFVAGVDDDLSWLMNRIDEELLDAQAEFLEGFDTMIMGRVNYLDQAAHWPTADEPLAPVLNGFTKLVFSTTLDRVEWEGTRLATRPPAEEIAELRAEPGLDIFVAGGARLAQSLLADGLIDEVRLVVQPVAIGAGIPLFAREQALDLLEVQRLASGALVTTYSVVHS